jgi:hypothetical protein
MLIKPAIAIHQRAMTASKIELVQLVHVSPRHAGRVGQLGTQGDSRYAQWEQVAQRGLDKMLFFFAAGFTQRRLHASDAAE